MGSEPLPKEPTSVFYVRTETVDKVRGARPATAEDITDDLVDRAIDAFLSYGTDEIGRPNMRLALEAVFRGH